MSLYQQHVLIVEDEIFIAVDLADTVRDAGGEVVGPAMSAPEALQLIEKHKITVAILDVRLGNHDSVPIAQRLETMGIPFVFHTGNQGNEVLTKNWPKATIVRKPATPSVVVAALAAVTRK